MAKKKARRASFRRPRRGAIALGARRGGPRRPISSRIRRASRTSMRRVYATTPGLTSTTKKSGRRGLNARKHNLNIREVAKKEGEVYEYEVFLCHKEWTKMARLQDDITSWVKSCISGKYKIYRHRYGDRNIITSIKLESEGDLMMFMLCYREHVRKIFKMVNEPLGAHLVTN